MNFTRLVLPLVCLLVLIGIGRFTYLYLHRWRLWISERKLRWKLSRLEAWWQREFEKINRRDVDATTRGRLMGELTPAHRKRLAQIYKKNLEEFNAALGVTDSPSEKPRAHTQEKAPRPENKSDPTPRNTSMSNEAYREHAKYLLLSLTSKGLRITSPECFMSVHDALASAMAETGTSVTFDDGQRALQELEAAGASVSSSNRKIITTMLAVGIGNAGA